MKRDTLAMEYQSQMCLRFFFDLLRDSTMLQTQLQRRSGNYKDTIRQRYNPR
jgi:hypothetical protein